MNIGIIIINFNGEDDTKECLESINKFYSHLEKLQIILVDNNSFVPLKDSYLNNLNLNILHIKNTENEGFAKGNNIGIKKVLEANCEYIALINNDTVLVDDSLQKVLNAFEKNKSYGIIGMINCYYSNPEMIWQSGFKSNLYFGFSKKVKATSSFTNLIPVDYVPGSSIVIRKSVFDEIGFLDERYFAYFEEYDFCIRAKRKKINIGFLNGSKILHKVGKSSTSAIQLYFRTRNKLFFYAKYATPFGYICAFIIHIIISLVRIIFSEREKKKLMKALIFGVKDYFNNYLYKGSLENIK